jgi:hypothetical protein
MQKDYLAQILKTHPTPILEAFAAITHQLCLVAEPLFIEDGNSAYSYKSIGNCCARWCTAYGIILMPQPSTSLDMNPIEKCWRRIKQALHRRQKQPTTRQKWRQWYCRGIEWMCRRGARSSGQRGRSACRQKKHSCAWKGDNTKNHSNSAQLKSANQVCILKVHLYQSSSRSVLSILTAATQLWSLPSVFFVSLFLPASYGGP